MTFERPIFLEEKRSFAKETLLMLRNCPSVFKAREKQVSLRSYFKKKSVVIPQRDHD